MKLVALSYFHWKKGPMVLSYPSGMLDNDLLIQMAHIMEYQDLENFFSLSINHLKLFNYIFEIKTKWAKGNKERLMISIILDHQITPKIEEFFSLTCLGFVEQLKSNEDIYTAFYIDNLSKFNKEEREMVETKNELLKGLIKKLYHKVVEYLKEMEQ